MSKDLGIKVIGSRCLILEDKNSEYANESSKIIIAGKKSEPTFRGTVIAVGDGARTDDGELVPMVVKEGDRVIYTSWSGSPIVIEDETYMMLNERDVLCVIED